ncbi:LysR family transcriptional regulator [Pseudonocardia sp. CA-107938]|uniref:LysR family transcriptional regulator n=1 Tax=Pseudonocardia sp. CA-107938 TaxID=3240021 RepID=UPI003D950641
MPFELDDLRLFLDVVDHGSITRAAALAHLSLPAASARIRVLEADAGSPLLLRHRRGATPTPSGLLLAGHARDVLARHERLRAELAEGAGATVVLPAISAVGTTVLVPVITAFLRAQPDIDVAVVMRTSRRIVADVASGRVEVGIAADSVDLGRLDARPLFADRLVVAVPRGHPLDGSAEVAFADCVAHPFAGTVEVDSMAEMLLSHSHALGARPHYRARLPDAAAVRAAVAAGVGIAVESAAAPHPDPARITRIPLSDPWATRTAMLVTRPGHRPSEPTTRLITHLLAHARA